MINKVIAYCKLYKNSYQGQPAIDLSKVIDVNDTVTMDLLHQLWKKIILPRFYWGVF